MGIAAVGLTVGAPSLAMADAGFQHDSSSAGPEGATLSLVRSHVSDDGSVSYEHVTYTAGPGSAGVDRINSMAE
ncbi:hypothetical protein [Nocardiopsis sp. JB363]|uniref:hypothetical protein n=1 Tax=Nocardiopsis sp. JB363 TaxID=1434837 RepID=UPI000979E14F|nr:hypothetical protein [Nocardiopsis sp. JB363]SIO90257.1 hypothetical protein BQ8420_25740 [Nocardiopsis sp. JB363]